MSDNSFKQGQRVYRRNGDWFTFATVERVTPSGQAILNNGERLLPDGRIYGNGGSRRIRYWPVTQDVLDEHALIQSINRLGGVTEALRKKRRTLSPETVRDILAALEPFNLEAE